MEVEANTVMSQIQDDESKDWEKIYFELYEKYYNLTTKYNLLLTDYVDLDESLRKVGELLNGYFDAKY